MIKEITVVESLQKLSEVNGWEFSNAMVKELHKEFKDISLSGWEKIIQTIRNNCEYKPTFASFYMVASKEKGKPLTGAEIVKAGKTYYGGDPDEYRRKYLGEK